MDKYIEILGLKNFVEFNLQNVKNQYKKLIMKYHPDTAEEQYKDGEKCKLLNAAYEYFSEYFKEHNTFVNTTVIKTNYSAVNTYSAYYRPRQKPMKERKEAFAIYVDAFDLQNLTWKKSKSSNVDSYAYDSNFKILFVIFKNKSNQTKSEQVYCYFDTPTHIYTEFENAKSQGQYVYYNLIGQFKCGKLDISHYPPNWQKFSNMLILY